MLVLSRRLGEEVVIGDNIRLTVVAIRGNQVQLGVTANPDVLIQREDLCQKAEDMQSLGMGPAASSPASLPEMEELETHVQSRLNGQVRHFRLMIRGCGLILTGYARTYYAKQLAQHAVLEATTLPILANEIEVC